MKASNNTLSVLLVMVMAISLFGTFASVSYISSNSITGHATSNVTGTTSVTVDSETSCTAVDSTIAFGTLARGVVNDSEEQSDFITIENNGNAIINVTAYMTEDLWDVASNQAPNANWRIHCNSVQDGGSTTCTGSYGNIPTSDGIVLSNLLVPADATDLLTVGVNITVPNDETAGAKTGTIKFVCLSSE
jgi:hypothetical protein